MPVVRGKEIEVLFSASAIARRNLELAKEIAAGFWLVGEPEASQIFRKDTGGMYEDLLKRMGKGKAPKKPGDREAGGPAGSVPA